MFTIGNPIPRPTDVIVLHVTSMSGYEQAFMTETQEYPNTPEGHDQLAHALRILGAAARALSDDGCEPDDVLVAIRSCAEFHKRDQQQAVDWYQGMVGFDVVKDGERARLDRAWVTYIDGKGTEFEVWIDRDDVQVSTHGITPR